MSLTGVQQLPCQLEFSDHSSKNHIPCFCKGFYPGSTIVLRISHGADRVFLPDFHIQLHLRGQSAKVASSGHLFQFSRPRSAESPDDIPTPCSHSDDLASAAQGYQVDSQPGLLVSARVGTCCGRKINSIQYIPMRINGWAVGPQQRYTHKTLRLGFSRCWRCAV